jgi:folate-dependent phosphoribosylglycinamide formyltransferase PurN
MSTVVMLAGPGESTRIVFHALDRAIGVAKVVLEQRVSSRQLLRRRIDRLGLSTVVGQVGFKLAIEPYLRRGSRGRIDAIKRQFDLDDSPIPEQKLVHVPSVNTEESIQALRDLRPDVVVVNGTRIISQRVLDSIEAPFLNTHAGITPLYRGVHGAYWALANRDRSHCGVTVHMVDRGIDTGSIVDQALIVPTDEDNFVTYPLLQTAAGLPLLAEAVERACAGRLEPRPAPEGRSRLWSHPTLSQYLRARIFEGVR